MNLEINKFSQIFLIGQSGSGKTTIGKILADKLSFKFIDTDTCITSEMKLSIKEIFNTIEHSSSSNKSLNLNIAFNYGFKEEIKNVLYKFQNFKNTIDINNIIFQS